MAVVREISFVKYVCYLLSVVAKFGKLGRLEDAKTFSAIIIALLVLMCLKICL